MRRIRALHLITHFAVGGATETVLTTCRHMDREHFETAILCGQTGHTEQSMLALAQDGCVPIYVLPSLRRSIHLTQEWRAYHDLVAWLREHPYDVIHTSGSKAGILGRLAAARAGVPVIVHTVFGWGHHDHMNPLLRRLYILLERRAARVTHRLITVSHANREKGLAQRIGQASQYEVIYNGIDIAKFRDVKVDAEALRQSLAIPVNAPVVGTVSRLAPQKAPEDFLKVARLVHARCPAARFVFVGGGPLAAEFEAGIRAASLEGVVHNLGYRNDVPALLRVFDVFLLTSLWEGLPMVCLQAMCAKLPIVATRVDGTPEAIADQQTGFLAEPHDCATQADRVLELLGDRRLRARMGQRASERVFPVFCDREMTRRIENLYQECFAEAMQRDASIE